MSFWIDLRLNLTNTTVNISNSMTNSQYNNFIKYFQTDILDINRLYKCNQSPVEESKPTNSSFVWVDDNNSQVKWAWNCGFSGYDISKRISSREGCNRLCIANLRCTHFTWGTGSYCYMKSAPKTAAIYRFQGAACGYITQRNTDFDWRDSNSGRIKWANGCDFYGHDFRQYSSGREKCISDCIADSRCTHFGWLERHNHCNLKTINHPIVATKLNLHVGICGSVRARV